MKRKDLNIPAPRRPVNSGAGAHPAPDSLKEKGSCSDDDDWDLGEACQYDPNDTGCEGCQ